MFYFCVPDSIMLVNPFTVEISCPLCPYGRLCVNPSITIAPLESSPSWRKLNQGGRYQASKLLAHHTPQNLCLWMWCAVTFLMTHWTILCWLSPGCSQITL